MKSSFAIMFSAVTLLVALVIPVSIGAQEQAVTPGHKKPHRYRFVDLGTFGGAAAYFGTSGDRTSQIQVLNNKGEVAGWATTSAPDPYPDFCWDGDCFLAHTFQWQNGVKADLGALVAWREQRRALDRQ